MSRNQYEPDTVSPPGATIRETMQALGLCEAQLAHRMGLDIFTVAGIIAGTSPITAYIATKLERVLGVSAIFWMNRERLYREWLEGTPQ